MTIKIMTVMDVYKNCLSEARKSEAVWRKENDEFFEGQARALYQVAIKLEMTEEINPRLRILKEQEEKK